MTNKYSEIDLISKSVDEKIEIIESLETSNSFNEEDFKTLDYLSQDEDEEVRAKVAEILVAFEAPEAEKMLIKLLRDKDELVRVNACDSLCNYNSLEVLNLLKDRILKDSSSLVRGYAALSIADIAISTNYNIKELSDFFEHVLVKEKVKWVKINFYKVLYIFGNRLYLDMLLNELKSRSYRNRCAVVNILSEITTSDNVATIKSALSEMLGLEKTVAVKNSIEKMLQSLKQNQML